jgi:hypothetical protein
MRQETKPITAEELVDRENIRQVFSRYSRGVDRQDEDLVRSTYWPGGWDNHGAFEGTIDEFIANFKLMWPTVRMQHMLGQIHIEIHGNEANTESYFLAYHRLGTGDDTVDMLLGGRYVDRLEKRDDEWRILHRNAIYDWYRDFGDSQSWDSPWFKGIDQNSTSLGSQDADLSWDYFARLPLVRGEAKNHARR